MNNIIGISHIVFTVDNQEYIESSYISSSYQNPKSFLFNHSTIKNKLIRRNLNGISKLSYFESKDNYQVPIETIFSKNIESRPKNSFGIINKSFGKGDDENFKILKHKILGDLNVYYCKRIQAFICNNLELIRTELGCWIEVSNFEDHIKLLVEDFGLTCIYQTNQIAVIQTKVINKSFSNFSIILLNSYSNKNYFNDDIGLSSIGWISNSEFIIKAPNFKKTQVFYLKLFENKFKTKFIYDNKGVSHEILNFNNEK